MKGSCNFSQGKRLKCCSFSLLNGWVEQPDVHLFMTRHAADTHVMKRTHCCMWALLGFREKMHFIYCVTTFLYQRAGGIVEKQNTVVNTTKRRRSTNIVEVYFHGTHDSKVLSMHFRAKSSAAAAAATPAPRHKHCIPTKTTEQHRQYYDYYYYYYCYTTTGRSLSSSCAACAHYHYALLVSITDTMQRHSFDCWASFSPSFCSAWWMHSAHRMGMSAPSGWKMGSRCRRATK